MRLIFFWLPWRISLSPFCWPFNFLTFFGGGGTLLSFSFRPFPPPFPPPEIFLFKLTSNFEHTQGSKPSSHRPRRRDSPTHKPGLSRAASPTAVRPLQHPSRIPRYIRVYVRKNSPPKTSFPIFKPKKKITSPLVFPARENTQVPSHSHTPQSQLRIHRLPDRQRGRRVGGDGVRNRGEETRVRVRPRRAHVRGGGERATDAMARAAGAGGGRHGHVGGYGRAEGVSGARGDL